jgi:hypothetical protein
MSKGVFSKVEIAQQMSGQKKASLALREGWHIKTKRKTNFFLRVLS